MGRKAIIKKEDDIDFFIAIVGGSVRWSSKTGHNLNLNLCSYGKDCCEKTAS